MRPQSPSSIFLNRMNCACQDHTSTRTISAQAGHGTSRLCDSRLPSTTNSAPHDGQNSPISNFSNVNVIDFPAPMAHSTAKHSYLQRN